MTDPVADKIQRNPKYALLKHKRNRLGVTLTLLMLVVYYGYIALIAFDKSFLAQPIGEGVTSLGIPIGLAVIIFTIVITGIYVAGALLTLLVDGQPGPRAPAAGKPVVARPSPWRDLKEGLVYVWRTPRLLAAMSLAAADRLTGEGNALFQQGDFATAAQRFERDLPPGGVLRGVHVRHGTCHVEHR